MRFPLAAALLVALPSARAERVPVAVVWLDGPHDAVAAVESAIAASSDLRSVGDAELRRVLAEGGPLSEVRRRVAAARTLFSAQRCTEADAGLAEAETIALTDLPVADTRVALAEIEPLRLFCADLTRNAEAAERAALLLSLCGASLTPEVQAVARAHPPRTPSGPQPPVRVESDPAGATVFVDLAPVGNTPVDLPLARRDDALIDIELPGHRKVHRAGAAPGTLAVALARDDRPGPLVDRVRDARGDAAESLVAELGRRAGAVRVLALRRASQGIEARLLDVATAKWSRPAVTVDGADAPARLVRYAALMKEPASKVPSPAAAAVAVTATPKPAAAPTPAWKRWYVWVAGGALVALVVGLVVAERVGSDELIVNVKR